MKSKTIKIILRKKINEWLKTIEDEQVKELASKNIIVTGGCIASMLLREDVNDFDIYFKNKETTLAVANYYAKRFQPQQKHGIKCEISVEDLHNRVKISIQSAGIASENGTVEPYQYFESRPEGETSIYVSDIMDGPEDIAQAYEDLEEQAQKVDDGELYRPIFLSTNAITLSHKIQIILRFFGEPDEIHENYDFIHCTNYWTSWNSHLELRKEALQTLLSRELIYVGSKYPVCSIFRLRKFINRGWTINAGQILKILMQVSALDLLDIEILEDQLTGVDCAYFTEVINKIKENNPEKIDTAYLIQIIDRMFE